MKFDHDLVDQRFDIVWAEYPIKKNKKKAKAAFLKAKAYEDNQFEFILKHIRSSKLNDKNWNTGFAPHLTTYLNNERWNDQIDDQIISKNKTNSIHDDFIL